MATTRVKRVFVSTPDIYSSLKNFLPAGTVTFDISSPLHSFTSEDDLAEDGWRTFPQAIVGFRDESGGIDNISFLVRHRFIAATYRVDGTATRLFVRVYVIPWDLAGSRGELRVRDDDVVSKGCKYLKQLFLRIRTDALLWDGDAASTSSPSYFVSQGPDNRSLLDIYNNLPSPSAEPIKGRIYGLRTKLYQYQRRSVATMMERETNPGTIEHPLYVPMQGMDGRVFYMQPATMEILSELPRVSAVRGGILCEELGTGKTIMILSLILATLNQLPAPEEGIHEERPVLTPLSFRRFQTAEALSARAKISGRKKPKWTDDDDSFPSLTEIILHKCRVDPDHIPWRDAEEQERLEQLRMWKPLMANVPFYFHSPDPPEAPYGRRARQQDTAGPKVMYLTTATLVVVPDNLRRQWANEILKHCTDFLRVLLVDDRRELPDAPALATNYDIVLMSQSRFSQESKKNNMKSLHSLKVCECKLLRRCKCSRRPDVSPLLQIRWKRLVVDEGHNTAEKRTEYVIFSKSLSVERRWIVTGTPTTNLLGLSFGAGGELQYPDDDDEMLVEPQRIWNADDREDLRKLGNMLTHFLLMMPFASTSEPKAFASLVASPLFAPSGPYPGDIDVLVQVMSSVMVRHRIEDVESEVQLALLDHKTVLLEMDPFAVKTYNLIQATIAVNIVDSERQHQDYLFHPRNAAHLQELVSNISHVMFWHVVDSGLDERLSNAEIALQNLEARNGTPEDFALIKQAIYHVRLAKDDPVWLALQHHYHVFREVHKIPPSIYDAWCCFPEYARKASPVALLSPAALMEMRSSVTVRPLSSVHKICEYGQAYLEKEQAYREYLRLQDRKKKSSRDRAPADPDKRTQSLDVAARQKAKEKKEEMKREMEAALARLNAAFSGEGDDLPGTAGGPSQRTVQSAMLSLSPIAGIRVGNSKSTKLDYILHDVLTYGMEDKFLIFSESAATLSFIAEAFDLCGVKYLSFSGQHNREERQSMITTFETSELYRVLLLELKHGARGLNLVSASRVIFCEPVWKADVESQAIKRVHRIGQTRNVVHVTTLAIKSTFEEVMVARSRALRENKQEFAKAATDDRTVRDFIEHPAFLPVPSSERLVNIDVPLFDLPPPAPPRPQPVIEIPAGPPKKKRKVVAFAS